MTSTVTKRAPSRGREGEQFRGIVCWDPGRVTQVMDTEALQTSPEVFLATHSPLPLFRGDLSSGSSLREYDEASFLGDFLAPADYAFVAVLGGAGTGKSHLVRWLSTRILPSERRRVLLIPRAGTSLHEVLRRVLEGIEGSKFDDYRKRLNESSGAISRAEARVRLLDNLAVAIASTDQAREGAPTDQEEYLASELPNLLRDPVFRSHFLQAGSVLDRLASHIVGGGGIERIEERRAFTVSDLPQRFQDVEKASAPAQAIYRDLVANPDLRHAAATWLTRHLDEAVTQLMRLSGTDLLQLMIDVRVELARREVELVLLIEDLATLQGIDQQLLESLIIRPRQPNMPQLCALRTAVAMTSGYYDGLRKNIHQRFDFRVEMGARDARGHSSGADVERFTARYLNAARLDAERLTGWYAGNTASSDDPEPVPSACASCAFREPCHKAFGAHDGMGLYPFSPAAVANIVDRVSSTGFNPRTQLKEGYRPVLENHAEALQAGRFPPAEMLERLGGSRLRAMVVSDLRRLDPSDSERRIALLDLWASAREVVNLDPIVHEAFDLPLLASVTTSVSGTTDRPDTGASAPTPAAGVATVPPPSRDALAKQIAALDDWSNGGTISQDLMQDLREVVYPAVAAHIDWNALHLIPGDFTGSSGFRQRYSINFVRQILAEAKASIRLLIPLRAEDLPEAALALQGLLRFRAARSWRFENGAKYYRAYLRQVESWSRHVIAQVDCLRDPPEPWDPIPAATELLAVGSRILGRPRVREPERSDLIDAIFAEAPERDESERSDAWQRLAKLVQKNHKKVQELVLSRVACSKGDSRRVQIIDAGRLLSTLMEARRALRPSQSIPRNLDKSSRFVEQYRDALASSLDSALQEERQHQIARYDAVARALGAEGLTSEAAAGKRRETIAALRSVLDAAAGAGVLSGVTRTAFEEKLAEFEGVQFQAWAESIQRLREEGDFARLLTDVSLVPASTGRVATEMIELAEKMLSRTEANVSADVGENERAGTEELERVQSAISAGLEVLESDVRELDAMEET